MEPILAALNRNVEIIEGVVVVAIVALIVGIVLSSRKKKKAASPKPVAAPTNYYADLQQRPSAKPDSFGTFGGTATPASAPFSAPPPGSASAMPAGGSALFSPSVAASTPSSGPFPTGQTFAPPSVTSPPPSFGSPAPDLAPAATTLGQHVSGPGSDTQPLAPSWQSDRWLSDVGATPNVDVLSLDGLQTTAPVAVAPPVRTPSPAPGTPPGWLPDPSGTPDTLRYWDGNAWTQHFAQRS